MPLTAEGLNEAMESIRSEGSNIFDDTEQVGGTAVTRGIGFSGGFSITADDIAVPRPGGRISQIAREAYERAMQNAVDDVEQQLSGSEGETHQHVEEEHNHEYGSRPTIMWIDDIAERDMPTDPGIEETFDDASRRIYNEIVATENIPINGTRRENCYPCMNQEVSSNYERGRLPRHSCGGERYIS